MLGKWGGQATLPAVLLDRDRKVDMFIKIIWHPKNNGGLDCHNVYQCQDYWVGMCKQDTPVEKDGPRAAREIDLYLDDCKRKFTLSKGDCAFIMNDEGRTIDRIVTAV